MSRLSDLQGTFYSLTDGITFQPLNKGTKGRVAALAVEIRKLCPGWQPNGIIQTAPVVTVPGIPGPQGPPGNKWHTGHGVPSIDIGVDEDLYLDRDSGDVYQKEGGSWV